MDAKERNGNVVLRRGHAVAAWRRALVTLLAVLAWLPPLPAGAQEDTQRKAAAEVLFNEGQKLLYEERFEAACQRFEQSQAADPGVGTLLYLGECYDRLGKPASAWATYREAESAAKAAGHWDRARAAQDRANRLEPTLPKLTVQVAAENPHDGFELTINGKRLDPALFGVAFPIDPGNYELWARAFGRTPWSSSIEVQPAEQQSVRVPLLAPAPARELEPLPATDPYGVAAPARDEADTGHALTPLQEAAIMVAAGGVTALAAGVVMGLVAKGKDDDAKPFCPDNQCSTPGAADLNEEARQWAVGANIAYGVGALALITGGALYFWPKGSSARAAGGRPFDISARLGPSGGLLTIGGVL